LTDADITALDEKWLDRIGHPAENGVLWKGQLTKVGRYLIPAWTSSTILIKSMPRRAFLLVGELSILWPRLGSGTPGASLSCSSSHREAKRPVLNPCELENSY
jgi:hypothetical protein